MSTMILIRHARRERDEQFDKYRERILPLCPAGVAQAKALAQHLVKLRLTPAVYYTSCFAHARETAIYLRDSIGNVPAEDVIALCSLTPHYQGPAKSHGSGQIWTGLEILKTVEAESSCLGRDMRRFETIAMVFHQPRIAQILAGLTRQKETQFRSLDDGSGYWVRGDSWDALLQGVVREHGRAFSAAAADS